MADLWKQVGALLAGRPHWGVQAMSTPGTPPVWCFEPRGQVDLSVRVDRGAICLYVMETDQDVILADVDALEAWLRTHREAALGDRRVGLRDRLKGGRLFRWD